MLRSSSTTLSFMNMIIIAFITGFLLGLPHLATSQLTTSSTSTSSCIPFNPITNPSLANVVNTSLVYFFPPSSSGLGGAEIASSAITLFLSGVSDGCKVALELFYGAKIYKPCDSFSNARFPCRSLCTNVVSACSSPSDLFSASSFFNDNFTDPATCSQSLYPLSYTANGTDVACYNSWDAVASGVPVTPQFGRCEPYYGSLCQGVLSASAQSSGGFYIPAGYCQSSPSASMTPNCLSYENLISNSTTLFQSITNTSCAAAVHRLICNSLYMPCDTFTVTSLFPRANTIGLPRYPSQDFCFDVVNQCYAGMNSPNNITLIKLPGQGTPAYVPNLTLDYWKVALLLPPQLAPNPTCTNVNPTTGQAQYPGGPLAGTIFHAPPTFVTTFANAKSSLAPTAFSVIPPQAQCVPFSSSFIINAFSAQLASAPLANQKTAPPGYDIARSYCMNVIPEGQPVYVPPGQSLFTLNNGMLRKAQWLFAIAPILNGCSVNIAKYFCQQAFMPCSNNLLSVPVTVYPYAPDTAVSVSTSLTITASVPSPPCQSVCLAFNATCQFLIQQNSALNPGNCSTFSQNIGPLLPAAPGMTKIVYANGTVVGSQPDFPAQQAFIANINIPIVQAQPGPGGFPFAPLSLSFSSTCSVGVSLNVSQVPYYCPYPTVDPYQPDAFGRVGGSSVITLNAPGTPVETRGSCALRCPPPIYTLDQYTTARNTFTGIAAISFAILLFMATSFMLFPEKREKTNVSYFILSTCLVSFSLILAPFNDIQKTNCLNNAVPANQNQGATGLQVFQPWLVHFASSSAVIWWAIQSIDVLIQVSIKRKITEEIRRTQRIVYHCVAWGVPLVFSLAALGSNSFGDLAGMPFNFMVSNYWSTFQDIVGVCIVVGCTCMTMIIIVIIKSSRASRNSTFLTQLKVLFRPILFIFSFLFVFGIVIGYTGYGDYVAGSVSDSVTAWVVCILQGSPQTYYGLDANWSCQPTPSVMPSFSLFMAFIFATAGQGIMVFLTYGTEKRLFELWWLLLRQCKIPRTAASQGGSQAAGASVNSKSNKARDKSRTTNQTKNVMNANMSMNLALASPASSSSSASAASPNSTNGRSQIANDIRHIEQEMQPM